MRTYLTKVACLVAPFIVANLTWSAESFLLHPSSLRRGEEDLAGMTQRSASPTASAVASTTLHAPAIAGRVGPVLKKFLLIPDKQIRQTLVQTLTDAIDLNDVALLGVIGWLLEPLAKRYLIWRRPDLKDDSDDYQETLFFRVASSFSQIAKVTGIIYAFDMVTLALKTLGFQIHPNAPRMFAQTAYTAWGAWRIRNFKNFLFRKAKNLDEKGKTLSRTLDGIIAFFACLFLADIFHVNLGKGITSVLTAGGVAGLVFSLASKDLAAALVAALTMRVSDFFEEGDEILLGDGTSGKVKHMGLLETDVKGHDGIVVRIPNIKLGAQRVKNLSRTGNCQVKQTLWFRYEDLNKIPDIIQDIKQNIRESCPKLITDGSRPFRVHLSDFKDDHVEVLVNANFSIKPYGDEFMDNQQAALLAIAQAVEQNEVELAVPNSIIKTVELGKEGQTKPKATT